MKTAIDEQFSSSSLSLDLAASFCVVIIYWRKKCNTESVQCHEWMMMCDDDDEQHHMMIALTQW